MKIVKTGNYDKSDLESLQKIQPFEFMKKTSLKRLNYLLGFIKKNKPEILTSFIQNLETKLQDLTVKNHLRNKLIDLTDFNSNFSNLRNYPDLVFNCINYYLQILQIPQEVDFLKENIEVTNWNYINSFLQFRYYYAQALTETIDRKEAINLFKEYIDSYVKSTSSSPGYDSLEEFRENRVSRKVFSANVGWIIIQGEIKDGKFPQRKDTCMWDDAIRDLPDIELKYLAACYGDFQGYNNNNENFILTMEHTIVEGHPYCSCVVHDIRTNNDLTHPNKEFFDNMWSLDE